MDWKLQVVVVPVADVDKAKDFYEGQLGFEVDHDTFVAEGARIVQLTPHGSACSIVIGTAFPQGVPGSVKGLQLVVSDIEAARDTLVGRGLRIGPIEHFEGAERKPGPGGDWNSFLFFDDPDGNSWAIQQGPPGT